MIKMVSYKYRLRLTKIQEQRVDEWINTSRCIYNVALETKIYAYRSRGFNLSAYDLMKQLTDCRKEFDWVKDVSIQVLQETITRVDNGYKSFFKGGGFPKWAKKEKVNSINFKITKHLGGNAFYLPKIGIVNTFRDRPIQGDIKKSTISRKNGKYYISVLTKQEISNLAKNENSIGLDMGITFFASDNLGNQIPNPRHTIKYQKRLRIESRSLARKKKGSNSRAKQKLVVGKLHEKIQNCRTDFLQKESTKLIQNYGTIVVEDLNVKGMVKNHNLAKHISDASWSEFFRMLQYKSDWHGRNFIKVNPRFTSQTCNDCGSIDKKSRISQSKFVCTSCGTESNADTNAAKNILGLGKALHRERSALAQA